MKCSRKQAIDRVSSNIIQNMHITSNLYTLDNLRKDINGYFKDNVTKAQHKTMLNLINDRITDVKDFNNLKTIERLQKKLDGGIITIEERGDLIYRIGCTLGKEE